MVGFTKDNLFRTKSTARVSKYTPTVTCILETISETRSMGRAYSIGLILKEQSVNFIAVVGGMGCPPEREYTKELMVKFCMSSGDVYRGEFRNGLKHGEGMEKFGNGDSYTGLYVNGLPDGYGEYFWEDGSHYKGDFKQGLRNGFGIWKKSNKPHCESYRGHYLLDKKSGYGLYVWNEGDYYKGHFFDDLKHGLGELYANNISVYYGMW